ncbi:MAG: hypothetical protein MI924_38525 [Chloroflexales bacterium]|nr:hypothetical protein [Chloroflexales bacterium]
MLIHLLIGAYAMWAVLFLIDYVNREGLHLTWWQWTLTLLNVLYFVFVAEVVYGFLSEGAAQAALVLGLLTAFFGVVWAVLLKRFVFAKPAERPRIAGRSSVAAE